MLFNGRKHRYCKNCKYSAVLDSDKILCSRKGVRPIDGKCFHFSYDPLKRVPARGTKLLVPKDSDFSL